MEHRPDRRWIAGRLPDGFYARPRLHLSWPGEIELENCKGVLLCTKETVRLDLGGRYALIRGDGLRLLSVQKGLIRLRGTIVSIEFASGEGGEKP